MLTASAVQVYAQQSGPATQSAPATHHSKGGSSPAAAATDPKTQASYSLGLLLGTSIRRLGINGNDISFEKFSQAFRAVMNGKAEPTPADQQRVQQYIAHLQATAVETNKAAARKFLAENKSRPGVKTTASGLQYRVLNEGSGASPHATDQVTVNYRGTLLDGTEFDSSAKHGQAATFVVNRVIPGWTEALQMMKPGAKWQLYIPPELAYGDRSPAPVVPPGSLLKFDVELLRISPPPPASPPGAAAPNAGAAGGRGNP